MTILAAILFALVVLAVLGWLGLKVKPKSFLPYPAIAPDLATVPLPMGLPAPVDRFYRTVYGEQIPVVESAIISGRATMRVFGIPFPARFRFTHRAGQDYRHYIETTLFGLPVFKVNEHYLGGQSRLELPVGVVENEPKIDQAANLGLWAESIWLPSIWLTDPRVRWGPADEHTALLRVPFGEGEQTFVMRFDPQSGLLSKLEAMRYRDAADEAKTLWIGDSKEWGTLDGRTTLLVSALTWFDQGRPWAVFTVEEVVTNVDVNEYVRARGP